MKHAYLIIAHNEPTILKVLLQMLGKHTIFRLDAHYSQTYLCAITK